MSYYLRARNARRVKVDVQLFYLPEKNFPYSWKPHFYPQVIGCLRQLVWGLVKKKKKGESKMFTGGIVKMILETKFQGNCINKFSSHG